MWIPARRTENSAPTWLILLLVAACTEKIYRKVDNKKKNYDLVVANIKSAAELYYQECKFGVPQSSMPCSSTTIKVSDLIKYGFIKPNYTSGVNKYLIDPKTEGTSSIKKFCTVTYSEVTNKGINVTVGSTVALGTSGC